MKTIFTCLFGNYDKLQNAPKFRGWETVLFTDQEIEDSKGWTVKVVDMVLCHQKESRRYKFLSHLYLPGSSLVCYLDANMTLVRNPPIQPTWFSHRKRSTIQAEAEKIIELGKADESQILNQLSAFNKAGFKDDYGLFQNGFFVRRHSFEMNTLMENCFDMVDIFTHRDQLALPFACHLIKTLPEGLEKRIPISYYVRLHPHLK